MRQELPSGNYIDVTPLPYAQAWEVAQTLLREIQKLEIDLKGVKLDEFLATDIVAFKGPICGILGSPNIQNAVKMCFNRCAYNQVKIDDSTFEPIERRGDYLFCAFYAIKENVFPFFGSLGSFFKTN